MVSSFVFELLRFLFLFGISVLLLYCLLYVKERKSKEPYFLDNKNKNYSNSGFFCSFFYLTKHHPKWLFAPFFIYLILVSYEVLSENSFSKVITVYDVADTVSYTKRIAIIPQELENGKEINPFDNDNYIINNSSRRLLLRNNTYSRSFRVRTYYYGTSLIVPKATFYCGDGFPEYLFEEPPHTKYIRNYKDRVVWSLECDKNCR